ncbi:MAG: methylcrotonoyl-CoA carboxylase, partial [Dongiaceae bacterium]
MLAPMPILSSAVNPDSDEFRNRADAMAAEVAKITALEAEIRLGGEAGAREKHVARGKLLPRERVRGLIDPGTAFLELGGFAAHGVYEDNVPA